MPCHDNLPAHTELQSRCLKAAQLLEHCLKVINEPVPPSVEKAANSYSYSEDTNMEPMLCEFLTNLHRDDDATFDQLMFLNQYWTKDLRNWWRDHRVMDAIREGREPHDPKRAEEMFKAAIDKLSRTEAIMLGCVDKWDAVNNFTPSTSTTQAEG